MLERKKFGPKGWNMMYPFSIGDLRDSALVLGNYMEINAASGKIPWDDLRYIFGEIMYGGHIVDDWDRRLCKACLECVMTDSLLDEAELFPFIEGKGISFKSPPALSYEKYIEHIETCPAGDATRLRHAPERRDRLPDQPLHHAFPNPAGAAAEGHRRRGRTSGGRAGPRRRRSS